MTLLSGIPGADQSVITYAIDHQGGTAATVRRVIREADFITDEQRQALLGAIAEALR